MCLVQKTIVAGAVAGVIEFVAMLLACFAAFTEIAAAPIRVIVTLSCIVLVTLPIVIFIAWCIMEALHRNCKTLVQTIALAFGLFILGCFFAVLAMYVLYTVIYQLGVIIEWIGESF